MENKLTENKELREKIINYLEKVEKNQLARKLETKTKNLLLTAKQEYDEANKIQKDYQELILELNEEEKKELFAEIKNLELKKTKIIEKIKEQIIEEEGIKQNVIIEIRPGPGGDEAGLFVRDLYKMYSDFAKKKGWKVEMVENKVGSIGNFDFVSFLVKGKSAFNYLKNEVGVHRVQRIPETGKKDKKHTSTATVVVLPEVQDVVLNIRPQDLKIETCRSSGAGGQHVNTTDSAVKITHLPTGIIATSQDGRSQHDNKERALTVLKSRIWEKIQAEKEKEIGNLRSSAIGTAERSENFRTYNFQGNRVVDKRLNIKLHSKVDLVIGGDLEEICQKSIDYEVAKKITSELENQKTNDHNNA